MNEKGSHIVWLPQGTQIWNFHDGVSRVLKQPFICLVTESDSNNYNVLYNGMWYNVAKNHVSILETRKEMRG
mgnify:CR=1 FL=1